MKKITKFLFVAALAALTVVSCGKKDPEPKPNENNEENQDPKPNENEEEEVKLAIDGKFAEWADVKTIEGSDGLLLMKTQVTDTDLYFYMEVDAEQMITDKVPYANYLSLYFDCEGEGTGNVSYWGDEAGSNYDVLEQIWLMQNGNVSLANWSLTGLKGKGKIDGGVCKLEFSFSRSSSEGLFKAKNIYFGAGLTSQYVEKEEGNEVWIEGETIGLCPAKGEDMAKVK